jgi:hypothetical protein
MIEFIACFNVNFSVRFEICTGHKLMAFLALQLIFKLSGNLKACSLYVAFDVNTVLMKIQIQIRLSFLQKNVDVVCGRI